MLSTQNLPKNMKPTHYCLPSKLRKDYFCIHQHKISLSRMVRDLYIVTLLKHISFWSSVKYLVSLLQPRASVMKSSDEAPNHSEAAVR